MIRDAAESDFESVLDMCEEFWKHTSYSEPFERDHTAKMLDMAFDHGLLMVLDIDREVVGFIAGIKSPLLASTQALIATELAWWVDPMYRGNGVGFKLMKSIEDKARNIGVKYWNMASMRSSNDKHANRIYERAGYKLNETVYQKVL